MTDPYKVLGISPNATDDEVKEAYRALSKLYHPDKNPDGIIHDIASEKMSELNAAYDQIMDMRRSGNNAKSGSSYSDIRSMIEHGNYTAAETALDSNRNDYSAEWHFLKGTVCLSRGWMNDAYSHYEKAVQLDPGNREYQTALGHIQSKRSGQMYGNPYAYNNRSSTNDTANTLCQVCECLICLDCLCDCF